MDFSDITYLLSGNERQQRAYALLSETNILHTLSKYSPILVGTFPIGIDVEGSDLDIVCQAQDLISFQKFVQQHFSNYPLFSDHFKGKAYVAGFEYSGMPFEIYVTSEPFTQQHGYRHMVVESRIMDIAGEGFREKIIGLKKNGYKTEPAFGKLLDMSEPYSELLLLENLSDEALKEFIAERFS
ncbi:hypothetical protein M2451_003436 [Dysgonomonas sp. PFB1-18]|uniref:DUF4269 domain-containing protein n=1 Tax=unclassified Dysgonomonas TaxID=2630389 RepID=UPI0024751019|nr:MULTISPECIES: DUF4269 domain-containing protein [unclassified Dysgonomonas]MDH6310645.1 hypothetical protein [Dysgonomonas sp. PF1-14]MDH6340496.1 hypothetical protein [Dysgonomonas sp. PF1-16]MDH6382096.1 hypothetical protein [Dysgonomonas sp. PFB1-18]MDH6399440.1 hypothetical protein [Dysgonomonas sp. PF1-23]